MYQNIPTLSIDNLQDLRINGILKRLRKRKRDYFKFNNAQKRNLLKDLLSMDPQVVLDAL